MREPATLSRRALAAAIPFVAIAGTAAAAPAISPALGLAEAASRRIDAAAACCREAKQALTAALDAYERALPAPHFTLDMTGQRTRPFRHTDERRMFDGKAPKRALDVLGRPRPRYVATPETIERDLSECPVENRRRCRLLFRMRRRAKARAAMIEALEASFWLDELQAKVDEAERGLEELTQELFREPATCMAAVLVQAKALSAYSATIEAVHVPYQAGRFGTQLAAGLQNVARAA